MYSINFTEKKLLSLHYNGANSYLFVNGTEIYKFKAKDSEIVASPLCLGNISEDWLIDNMKKTGFNGYVYDFSVDYDATSVDDIRNIHKYLMKKNLDASVCNNKQQWHNDKCQRECKELIDKGICDKGYIWNPSNCKCECDKSCDFVEYLYYENCKCRKRLIDKLIEECNENTEETSLNKINLAKCKSNSCILYIVLFSILFTMNIGIFTYFVYYKYVNHNKENVSVYDFVYQGKNNNIKWD